MKLYNSLTRKKEELRPKIKERVNLFVCGPTVYDRSHLGHARTYLYYDALVKFLRQKLGLDIFYLQNITNVEDKIIKRAKEEGRDPLELAKEFEDLHLKDMESLGIDSVSKYAPATEYIDEIISQVERLVKKGNAYKIEGDGYYFDITSFPDYGKLSGRTAEDAEDAVTRIDESINKKNRGDFALWKLSDEKPSWPSSLGEGRPGWHIEDTAITEKVFGFTYDLHGGAVELKFPHHEAEIAQMESLSGIKPMVKMWVHTGVLNVGGVKMAKSQNNFITIEGFLKDNPPQLLRLWVFSSNYRSPTDYSGAIIKEIKQKQDRLLSFYVKLREVKGNASPFPWQDFVKSFWKELEDDFNTPKALARLFELVSNTNKFIDTHTLSQKDAKNLLDFVEQVNDILNIIPVSTKIPELVKDLVRQREDARKKQDFSRSDELRKQIIGSGYVVEDTPNGPRVYKNL